MFRDRTTDVTYCADVTFFLHGTSGGLSLTAVFSLRRVLAFHCFKCYLASNSRYKTVFYPILCRLNTLNKTKLARNG